jgi:hypothetical protein
MVGDVSEAREGGTCLRESVLTIAEQRMRPNSSPLVCRSDEGSCRGLARFLGNG